MTQLRVAWVAVGGYDGEQIAVMRSVGEQFTNVAAVSQEFVRDDSLPMWHGFHSFRRGLLSGFSQQYSMRARSSVGRAMPF
jgi:hypothetical protein